MKKSLNEANDFAGGGNSGQDALASGQHPRENGHGAFFGMTQSMKRRPLLALLLWAGLTAAAWGQTNSAWVDTNGCAIDDATVCLCAAQHQDHATGDLLVNGTINNVKSIGWIGLNGGFGSAITPRLQMCRDLPDLLTVISHN